MSDKKYNVILILSFIVLTFTIIFSTTILVKKLEPQEPQVINTYDSELVEISIGYKDDVYTVDIEKYNKHFTVNEKDTKIIVYYENKAVIEEYNNGTVKIYFYIGLD